MRDVYLYPLYLHVLIHRVLHSESACVYMHVKMSHRDMNEFNLDSNLT